MLVLCIIFLECGCLSVFWWFLQHLLQIAAPGHTACGSRACPRHPQAPGSSCLGFLTLFLFPEYSLLAPSFLLKSPCPSLKTQVKLFSLHVWQVAPIPGGEDPSAPSLGTDRCQILFYAELQGGDCHLDTAFSFNSALSYLLDGSNVLLFSKGHTTW